MIETCLNNHYKDRQPEETIQIIKQFFLDRGFFIKEEPLIGESGTWSYKIALLFNNDTILMSNGKGMTQSFALASGLAELYERFCTKLNIFQNTFLLSDFGSISRIIAIIYLSQAT